MTFVDAGADCITECTIESDSVVAWEQLVDHISAREYNNCDWFMVQSTYVIASFFVAEYARN